MTKKRYYSKGAPTEEPKAPVSCESSGIGMRANVVLPEVSPKYVKKRLKSFCKKIDVPYNQQGWGVLDVYGFIKNNN